MEVNNQFDQKYKKIRAEIKTLDIISPAVLQRKFEIGYVNANIAIQRLLAEDLIIPMVEDYKYQVVK